MKTIFSCILFMAATICGSRQLSAQTIPAWERISTDAMESPRSVLTGNDTLTKKFYFAATDRSVGATNSSGTAVAFLMDYTITVTRTYALRSGRRALISSDTIFSDFSTRYDVPPVAGTRIEVDGPAPPGSNCYPSTLSHNGGSSAPVGLLSYSDTPHDTLIKKGTLFQDTLLSKWRSLRRMFENEYFARRTSFFVVGFGGFSGWANRSLRISTAQYPDQSGLLQRQAAERANETWGFNLSLGASLGRTDMLLVDFTQLSQGWRSTGPGVDPKTGLPAAASGYYDYRVQHIGLGVLYSFSGYGHPVNGALDAGIYSVWRYEDGSFAGRKDDGTRTQQFVLRAGLGLNVHPIFAWEIRVVPTVYYNINSINTGSILRANLLNYGLSVNLLFRNGHGLRLR